MNESDRLRVLLQMQSDLGAAMRFQGEAEHLYTAATIAGAGAFAWGTAALPGRPWVSIIATLGILALAWVVSLKIMAQHNNYERIKGERAGLIQILRDTPGGADLVPSYLLERKEGAGAAWSRRVVWVAAVAAALFSLSSMITPEVVAFLIKPWVAGSA